MRIAARIAALALAIAGCLPALAADQELDTGPATAAASAWLELLDGQRYADSWEQASTLFREATPKLQWETSAQSVRGPLGPVNFRKMRAANYARVLPGAPEGEYVVIQYDTSFANRPNSTETLTPSKEKDGTWKVSGYYIR
jgi:hypothetical protein